MNTGACDFRGARAGLRWVSPPLLTGACPLAAMNTHTDAWIELAHQLGKEQFLARHPGFFLFSSDKLEDTSAAIFETKVGDFAEPKPRRSFSRTFEVRWIAKGKDNPYADRISVGRARNCDVSFRHPSVSTLHALFRIDGQQQLTVTDQDSSNGTFVNGERLVANRPRRVHPQDRIQFGAVDAMVLDADGMFDLLSRFD